MRLNKQYYSGVLHGQNHLKAKDTLYWQNKVKCEANLLSLHKKNIRIIQESKDFASAIELPYKSCHEPNFELHRLLLWFYTFFSICASTQFLAYSSRLSWIFFHSDEITQLELLIVKANLKPFPGEWIPKKNWNIGRK